MPYKLNDTGEQKAIRASAPSIRFLKDLNDEFFIGGMIFDIGANVGHVSRYLLERGAGHVVGYEPHPVAFKSCSALHSEFNDSYTPIQAAVGNNSGKMFITTSQSDDALGYFCNSILRKKVRRGLVANEVEVVAFKNEIEKHKPSGIKMDIEGSEFDILLNNEIPDHVKWISLELHGLKDLGAYLMPFVIERLFHCGLAPTKLPTLKAVDDRCTNSFFGSEVVNFTREGSISSESQSMLLMLKGLGRNAYAKGYRPADEFKLALFERYYGDGSHGL